MSWSISAGSHAIWVIARTGACSVSPSMVYPPTSVLQPALTLIEASWNDSRISESATRSWPTTSVDTNVRPSRSRSDAGTLASDSAGWVLVSDDVASLPQAPSTNATNGAARRMRGRFTMVGRSPCAGGFPTGSPTASRGASGVGDHDTATRQAISIIWSTPDFMSSSLIRTRSASSPSKSLTVMMASASSPFTAAIV